MQHTSIRFRWSFFLQFAAAVAFTFRESDFPGSEFKWGKNIYYSSKIKRKKERERLLLLLLLPRCSPGMLVYFFHVSIFLPRAEFSTQFFQPRFLFSSGWIFCLFPFLFALVLLRFCPPAMNWASTRSRDCYIFKVGIIPSQPILCAIFAFTVKGKRFSQKHPTWQIWRTIAGRRGNEWKI